MENVDIATKNSVIEDLKKLKEPDHLDCSDTGEICITYFDLADIEKKKYLYILLKSERCIIQCIDGDRIDDEEIISYIQSWRELVLISVKEYLNLE